MNYSDNNSSIQEPDDIIIEQMGTEEYDGDDGNARPERKEKKKRTVGGFLFNLFPFVCLAVLGVSLWFFVPDYLEYKAAKESYQELQDSTITVTNETAAAAPAVAEQDPAAQGPNREDTLEHEEEIYYPVLDIGFEELASINEDFVGVLYVPALDIVYPVAHSKDNKDYLNTTFQGAYNSSGCIFLDCEASGDLSDRHSIIFGHNMKNGTMFGSLKKFMQDEEICREDPYFYIYTPEKVYVFRIFAYNQISTRDDMYADGQFYEDDKDYDRFIIDSRERSLYHPSDVEADFSKRPRIVTLSTCFGTGHVYNFIVQGVLLGTADLEGNE